MNVGMDILVAALREWQWKIGATPKPLFASLFGDVFFKATTGEVFWLNTGTGSVEKIATDETALSQLLDSKQAELWLLPGLAERLIAAGKTLAPGECYTFIILPIFNEGKYEVENVAVVPALEHFKLTADIHRQIADLPDGAPIRLNVTD